MVIRGGENVYPREVEEFLYRHPKVHGVQVIGVPDVRYDEELCACACTTAKARRRRRSAPSVGSDRALQGAALRQIRNGFPMTVTGKRADRVTDKRRPSPRAHSSFRGPILAIKLETTRLRGRRLRGRICQCPRSVDS
jgi:acyl-CoA synthetase (AMP-forming)/AMP-acid ligase II